MSKANTLILKFNFYILHLAFLKEMRIGLGSLE